MSAPYKIRAMKRNDDGKTLSYCETKDPDAVEFEISYFIRALGFSSTQHFDSLHDAEQLLYLLNISWEEGKLEAFAELRKLIGVK